jgi:hypothetical protein
MWPYVAFLRIQAAAEYVSVTTGLQGAGDLLWRVGRVLRENPLETAGVLVALVLVFVVMARFNSL